MAGENENSKIAGTATEAVPENLEETKIVENTKESYYDTLQKSSINWHESKNYYDFFVEYYLGIILSAYKDFSNRVEYISNKKMTIKQSL